MHALATRLQPIPRSLTGDGFRATLGARRRAPPARGARGAFGDPGAGLDRPARVERARGVDPRAGRRARGGLRRLGAAPRRVQRARAGDASRSRSCARTCTRFRTTRTGPPTAPSYYREAWGFCLPHRVLEALPEGEYEVCIDATLEPGHLTYAECVIPGSSAEEVLLSCHACHPTMANDNLSGIALAVALGRELLAAPARRYRYRILFIPGHHRLDHLAGAQRGGGRAGSATGWCWPAWATPAPSRTSGAAAATPTWTARWRSRCATPATRTRSSRSCPTATTSASTARRATTSRSAASAARRSGATPSTTPRPTTWTSSGPEQLGDAFEKARAALDVLERNRRYRNLSPKGEPQLGRRGLYRAGGGTEPAGLRDGAPVGAQPLRRAATT